MARQMSSFDLFDLALSTSARGAKVGIQYDSKMDAKMDMREFVDYCRYKKVWCKPIFSKMHVEFAMGSGRARVCFLACKSGKKLREDFDGVVIEWT